jgi:AraC family transcriptional regulator, transcriptional activator of pobA
MQFRGISGEYFGQLQLDATESAALSFTGEAYLAIFWAGEVYSVLEIDGIVTRLQPHEMIFLTHCHQLKVLEFGGGRLFAFNRPFYCLDYHDDEVGCKGMLFFGARHLPLIRVAEADMEIFNLLWRVFSIEMAAKDKLQMEMLRMLLKRWVILCTRVFVRQGDVPELDAPQSHLIREFHYLIEQHFRSIHDVKGYASLLHKSPKTLSHLFAQAGQSPPLQAIQARLLQEARRQLRHTDRSISEIAFQIGFEDVQSFSRFFRNKQGVSPKMYREGKLEPLTNPG